MRPSVGFFRDLRRLRKRSETTPLWLDVVAGIPRSGGAAAGRDAEGDVRVAAGGEELGRIWIGWPPLDG